MHSRYVSGKLPTNFPPRDTPGEAGQSQMHEALVQAEQAPDMLPDGTPAT